MLMFPTNTPTLLILAQLEAFKLYKITTCKKTGHQTRLTTFPAFLGISKEGQ